MGGVRKSLGGCNCLLQHGGVGLVGADRSKLERKKLCIILCPAYLRIVLNKLLNKLKFWTLIVFWGGVEKIFGGVQKTTLGEVNKYSGGGVRTPRTPPENPSLVKMTAIKVETTH